MLRLAAVCTCLLLSAAFTRAEEVQVRTILLVPIPNFPGA